jgi:hypothetical protein
VKVQSIAPLFVEFMPSVLEPGLLYISPEYRVTKHLCASGCGEAIVLPLHPGQWRFTYDGEHVSVAPSVGNASLPCRAHYWIRDGQIVWAAPLSRQDARRGRVRDRDAIEQVAEPHRHQQVERGSWWSRLRQRLRE